jgi:hypothetical protein
MKHGHAVGTFFATYIREKREVKSDVKMEVKIL